jgi:integrase
MLTDLSIRALKPSEKARKAYDEKGLYLLVNPGGSRLWRFKYSFPRQSPDSKERLLALGAYPEVSLKEARDLRDEARRLLREGVDPIARRRETATITAPTRRSFESVALEWWAARKESERWDQDYAAQIKRQFERDVFPVKVARGLSSEERVAHPLLQRPVGQWPFDALTPPDVLELCKNVEVRGALDTARDLRSRIGMVYKREMVLGRCAANPAENVVALLGKPHRRNHAALTYEELPEFFRRFSVARMDPSTALGLEAVIATWLRSTELRLARWQWLNQEARELRIPSHLMKNGNKGEGAHVVPLSDYALDVFRRLREASTHDELMFPSLVHPGEPISDGAWLGALYRMGYRNKATVHGIRALGSTTANEAHVTVPGVPVPVKMWESRWIDRQLDHADGTVSGRYNRSEYLEPRRALMQWWGEKVLEARAVASLKPAKGGRADLPRFDGSALTAPF